jgi:hypothetical protein
MVASIYSRKTYPHAMRHYTLTKAGPCLVATSLPVFVATVRKMLGLFWLNVTQDP